MELRAPRMHKSALETSWALYGTSCEEIKKWATFFQQCSPRMSVYIDAAHHEQTIESSITAGNGYNITHSATLSPSPWKVHWINGNHFQSHKQIVIHDPKKLASLERRRDQLTQVDCIISAEGIPPHLLEWGVANAQTPCFAPHDIAAIEAWVRAQLAPLPVAGLILTGGKSERMGRDKAMLDYHGMPQWEYLKSQCELLDIPVFVSCKKEQQDFWSKKGVQVVVDQWPDMGPMAGILSAMKQQPMFSWMVMACDMPNWNAAAMRTLIENRKSQKGVTAFFNEEKKWHEPLGAIWESDIEGSLFQWSWVSACPRKFLHQIPTHSIEQNAHHWLDNINDPATRERWFKHQGE